MVIIIPECRLAILAAKSTDAQFEEAKLGGGGSAVWGRLVLRVMFVCTYEGFISVVVKSCGAKCESNRGG